VNELDLLDGAARGMSAQRTLLDIAARNVAAAQAAVPGHPYQRLVARLAAPGDAGDNADAVRVAVEPGSGDALTELISVLDAQRAYEADASMFDTGKRLVERTLDIER
jgi:flagellar basal body rod protein FlgC